MAVEEIIKVRADISDLQRQLTEIDAKFDKAEKGAQGLGTESQKSSKKATQGLKQQSKAIDNTTKRTDKFKKSLNGLAQRIGAAFAVAQIARFAGEMRNLAIEIEQLDQKARIVFGDALPMVTKESENAANALGLTNREFRSAAAGVADILVPLGFARERSAELAVETTKLAGAISNWSGGQYSAAESAGILQKALVGETEQLKSVGIVVDQSSKQFNERLKIIQRDQGLTLQQARAMDILDQVTSQSLDAQTAFADGTENIAVQQAKADARAREAKEAFAEMITPAIISMTGTYADLLQNIADRLTALGEGGIADFFDSEMGKNIRTAKKEVESFAETFVSEIDDLDDSNIRKYYRTLLSETRKVRLQSAAFQALEAEQQEKIRLDIENELESLIKAELARRKLADAAGDEAAVQQPIIQSLKERIKLYDDQIEAATTESEILRLNAQRLVAVNELKRIENRLSEQEALNQAKINAKLNERQNLQEFEDTPDRMGELDFDWVDEFEGIYNSVEREQKASYERQEAEADKFLQDGLDARIENNEKKAESDKKLTDLQIAQQEREKQAITEVASNMFATLGILAEDNANASKALAIFQTTIAAFQTIATVLKDPLLDPVTRGALAISYGALAFAQVSKIQATEVPSFYTGTDFVALNGNPKGKDTIPSMLHEGEAVIPSKENKKYPGLSTAWIKGDLEKYISTKHIKPVLEKHKEIAQKEKAALLASAIRGSVDAKLDDTRMYRELKRSRIVNQEVANLLRLNKSKNPYRA